MPALPKNSPILFISPDQSFFANLNTEGKTAELTDVTSIDMAVIKNNKVQTDLLEKALAQLDVKSLQLIVSDDIFLHYIGDFPVNDKLSLEEHISNTVGKAFPDQEDPLHIVTLDLAKTARIQTIQITAMSKENLQSISDAFHVSGITLKNMIPASFVVKAFVSIDPSLFVLQTPNSYLLTSHYIGVEYAKTIDSSDISNLTEELATLKDSHPHLQHVYLSLAEDDESIKTAVEEVFPSQPVTIPKIKADSDTPHVLKALTLGYREVIENKFPYPQFEMPESTATPSSKSAVEEITPIVAKEEEVEDEKETIEPVEDKKVEKDEEKEESSPLQKPVAPAMVTPVVPKLIKPETSISADSDNIKSVEVKSPTVSSPVIKSPITPPAVAVTPTPVAPIKTISSTVTPDKEVKPVAPVTAATSLNTAGITPPASTPKTTVVKKKRNIFSYILLGTVIAIVIGLVGGGIVISQSALQGGNSQQAGQVEPIPSAEPTPMPTPTPEATPEPIAKDDVNILVVNATSKAGYAGTTANALKKAGYTKVQTGNAKGEYEKAGTFIMIQDTDEMKGLEAQLEKDASLTLEALTYDKTEDSAGTYDVVIVLNQ